MRRLILVAQVCASLALVPAHNSSHYTDIAGRRPARGSALAAGDLWDCVSWPSVVHQRVHGTYWLVAVPQHLARADCLGPFFPDASVLYNSPAEAAKKWDESFSILRIPEHACHAAWDPSQMIYNRNGRLNYGNPGVDSWDAALAAGRPLVCPTTGRTSQAYTVHPVSIDGKIFYDMDLGTARQLFGIADIHNPMLQKKTLSTFDRHGWASKTATQGRVRLSPNVIRFFYARGTLDFDHTKYGLIVKKQAALDELNARVHRLFDDATATALSNEVYKMFLLPAKPRAPPGHAAAETACILDGAERVLRSKAPFKPCEPHLRSLPAGTLRNLIWSFVKAAAPPDGRWQIALMIAGWQHYKHSDRGRTAERRRAKVRDMLEALAVLLPSGGIDWPQMRDDLLHVLKAKFRGGLLVIMSEEEVKQHRARQKSIEFGLNLQFRIPKLAIQQRFRVFKTLAAPFRSQMTYAAHLALKKLKYAQVFGNTAPYSGITKNGFPAACVPLTAYVNPMMQRATDGAGLGVKKVVLDRIIVHKSDVLTGSWAVAAEKLAQAGWRRALPCQADEDEDESDIDSMIDQDDLEDIEEALQAQLDGYDSEISNDGATGDFDVQRQDLPFWAEFMRESGQEGTYYSTGRAQ